MLFKQLIQSQKTSHLRTALHLIQTIKSAAESAVKLNITCLTNKVRF